jgi:[ribosomal protein S5]-alanine N-acetyltransferase
MVFQTNRLRLRPIRLSDAEAMFAYARIPTVGPKAGWSPHISVEETKVIIRAMMKEDPSSSGVYAVTLLDDVLIGTIDIHHITPAFKGEIGLVLHPNYHNQGIMEEAANIMIMMGFECLHFKRLEYRHFKDNAPSERLRQKLLFQYEGIHRKGLITQAKEVKDVVVAAMTDDDYFHRHRIHFNTFKKKLVIASCIDTQTI